MAEPNKGRIAIKFGAPASTAKPGAAKPGNRKPPGPPSSLGKRPRAAWDDDGSDSDDQVRHETITGFGAEGAETESSRRKKEEAKKEYIIARQPNRDWRSEMRSQRRGKNLLPAEAQQAQSGQTVETEPASKDTGIKWGLTITKKEEDDEGVKKEEDDDSSKVKDEPEEEDTKIPRTADDDAIDALMGRKPADSKPAVTIRPASETDAYQRDVQGAGEASTLEDYEAMPVEEFGAALLRGMGWDGKERGSMRHTQVKRRPNRLGLGAKELKEDEDLGGWNQGGPGGKKRSRPRLDEYRRQESKKRDDRAGGREDSYKRERERERNGGGSSSTRDRDRDADRSRHRDFRDDRGYRDRDHDRNRRDRDRDRPRGYDRDRRR